MHNRLIGKDFSVHLRQILANNSFVELFEIVSVAHHKLALVFETF